MSWLHDVTRTVKSAARAVEHKVAPHAHAHAAHDVMERAKARPATTWWMGRPLSEGKNAHKTNTRQQLDAAMKDGSNWFEGDVRKEIHGDRVEMRHDPGQESGDNLTLKEWLAKGKASGRGLKLDVKDSYELPEIIKEVKAAHVPSERLMWNLGDGELDKFGKQIRKEFPNSIIAINSGTTKRAIEHAKALGRPVTFVKRFDQVSDKDIKRLERFGPISLWNDTGVGGLSSKDIPKVTAELRRRGVTGMIDLRPSDSTLDKIEAGADKLKNDAGEFVRNRVDDVAGFFGF